MSEQDKTFEFREHAHAAVASYLEVRGFYEELATVVRRIIEEAMKAAG